MLGDVSILSTLDLNDSKVIEAVELKDQILLVGETNIRLINKDLKIENI